MLNHLDFLAGWIEGWRLDRDSVVALEFLAGRQNVDKRSASVAAESPTKLGSLTVWESGELEAEVIDLATQDRTFVLSHILEGPQDFGDRLSRFVREMVP